MANYRNVYKSDHLGVVDLEDLIEQGKSLVFTIKEVKQEFGVVVAGNRGDFNIAYFNEPIKPLVLNATNAATVRRIGNFGVDVDSWKNIEVELYIDANVKMKGLIVGGVRIKKPVVKSKPELVLDSENFNKCKAAYLANNAVLEQIKAKYQISDVVLSKLVS
jgi:hypothetical protein